MNTSPTPSPAGTQKEEAKTSPPASTLATGEQPREGLQNALRGLFALPNWENRCGEWKDINFALHNLEDAWVRSSPPSPQSTATPAQQASAVPGIPRRAQRWLWHPVECAIADVIDMIEVLGATPGLTAAIVHLNDARDKVSDFVDEKGGDATCGSGLKTTDQPLPSNAARSVQPTSEAAAQEAAPEAAAEHGSGSSLKQRVIDYFASNGDFGLYDAARCSEAKTILLGGISIGEINAAKELLRSSVSAPAATGEKEN